MATVKSINNYTLYISSYPKFNEWQANILLWQDSTLVIDLRFVQDPESYVALSSINANGVSLIYSAIGHFPWFVDVLRNEKPLSVALYAAAGTTPPRMLLQTSPEPIGETE